MIGLNKICEYGKTGSCALRYNGKTQCGASDEKICPLDIIKRRGLILHTFMEERKVGNDGVMDLERILNEAQKDIFFYLEQEDKVGLYFALKKWFGETKK